MSEREEAFLSGFLWGLGGASPLCFRRLSPAFRRASAGGAAAVLLPPATAALPFFDSTAPKFAQSDAS